MVILLVLNYIIVTEVGSQLNLADGYLCFDCDDMAHIYYLWKKDAMMTNGSKEPIEPYWLAEQAYSIFEERTKIVETQEDLDKIISAFSSWYPINEMYIRQQYSYYKGDTLTPEMIENINRQIKCICKLYDCIFEEV